MSGKPPLKVEPLKNDYSVYINNKITVYRRGERNLPKPNNWI